MMQVRVDEKPAVPSLAQRLLAADERPSLNDRIFRVRRAEFAYGRRLAGLARQIGDFVQTMWRGDTNSADAIGRLLRSYADTIEPWAEAVAKRMLAEVANRDRKVWGEYSARLGRALHREIEAAPTGQVMRERLAEQVKLITSLPVEAAERVRHLATEAIVNAGRASEIEQEILRSGEVAKSRAAMIARTEVSRTATELTRARAEYVGSTHFIWRTAGDSDVRPSHKRLNGKVFRWDDPPECDPGYHALPGAIFNCFPGYVRVDLSQGIRRLYRAAYHGPLVHLVVGPDVIDVTHNHPVLTRRGFVPAGQLDRGDEIVCMSSEGSGIADAHEDLKEPTFNELRELLSAGFADRVGSSRFDFYGDAINGEVDVIPIDIELTDDTEAPLLQQLRQFSLAEADGWMGNGQVGGCRDHVVEPSAPRLRYSRDVLRRRLVQRDQLIRGITAAERVSVAEQRHPHGRDGDIEVCCDGRGTHAAIVHGHHFIERQDISPPAARFAGARVDAEFAQFEAEDIAVASDHRGSVFEKHPAGYEFRRLTDKSVGEFSGHVFTIETATGLYGVGSVRMQVKNCRCYAEVIIPEAA